MTLLEAAVKAFAELNAIRARDGAPPGVDPDYFSSVIDGLDAAVKRETGHTAHCHPALYGMNRCKYVGSDKSLQGHTALGRHAFVVQLDDPKHPWSHGWHICPETDWKVQNAGK